MPTEYTVRLQNMNYDLKKWLLTDVPRAFRMCIGLRDNTTQAVDTEQLRKMIESSLSTYQQEHIEKLKKYRKEIESKTDEEWEKEFEEKLAMVKEEKEKAVEKFSSKKENYLKVKDKLLDMKRLCSPIGDIPKNIVDFALQQVRDTIDFDCSHDSGKYYTCADTWEKYKEDKFKSLKKDEEYHKEQAEEEKQRNEDALKGFDDWVEFVEMCFKEE